MEHNDHFEHDTQGAPRGYNWVLIGFQVIAAFFLFAEHRAHLAVQAFLAEETTMREMVDTKCMQSSDPVILSDADERSDHDIQP